MWNSRFRDFGVAFGLGSPLGLRRLAGAYWPAAPAAPAAPEAEGVEGGRSSDPSSGRRRRRIISLFAAMRAARRRSYAVSPYVRARARSRRVGEAVSACRARTRRDARGSKGKESVVSRAERERRKTSVARRAGEGRAGEGRARTSSGSPASAIAALALVRGGCEGVDVRVRARLWRGGTARGISSLVENKAQSHARFPVSPR
jgi:hypothetical protein